MGAPADGAAAAASISSAKAILRKGLLAARRRNQPDPEAAARLSSALLGVPEVARARVVAGYAALPGEPDVRGALDALAASGVQVLLPVVLDDRDLEFRAVGADAALVMGPLGVQAPGPDAPTVPLSEADVVLVPAVGADRDGHRLGRGGGCYDRALRRVRPDAFVVAVVRESELLNAVPVEPHDYPVDAVLAGEQLVRARSR